MAYVEVEKEVTKVEKVRVPVDLTALKAATRVAGDSISLSFVSECLIVDVNDVDNRSLDLTWGATKGVLIYVPCHTTKGIRRRSDTPSW